MRDSDRQRLRQQMRQARRSVSPSERQRAERSINQRLIERVAFHDVRNVAFYSAFDGEPDLTPAITAALDSGKRVFLPVLPSLSDAPLAFAPVKPGKRPRTNRHGIKEPAVGAGELIEPDRLGLVIAPLVAFDNAGNRLGMGAGYYDRTFAFVLEQRAATPLLMGVAFERQKHPALDPQPWDVPLQGVVTESRHYHFQQKPHPGATEN